MSIMNKVTLKAMWLNRTRTIVSIIGVILSVALITGVTTSVSTLQNYLVQYYEQKDGDWHLKAKDVSKSVYDEISENENVEKCNISKSIGFSPLPDPMYMHMPFLYITAFSSEMFDLIPVELLSGRLPQNENELLIASNIKTDETEYNVGDTLTIPIGYREYEGMRLSEDEVYHYSFYDSSYYEELGVSYSDQPVVDERFVQTGTMTYKIVGVYSVISYGSSFRCITRLDTGKLSPADTFDAYIKVNDPSEIYKFADDISAKYNIKVSLHSDLLQAMGISDKDGFNAILEGLGTILIILIMFGSILLIYNSFSISVSERTKQFGLLSSVGATGRQIRRSVLFEGFFISIIGIPLGLIVGITGIGTTFILLGDVFQSVLFNAERLNMDMTLKPSLAAIIIAVVSGFLTIIISALIPAVRASRLSAIDAIRQTSDIKIKPRAVKVSKLTQWLFGVEGVLASKNFKRNRRKYRTTVVSLFVSIVLFVSSSAFGHYLKSGFEGSHNETPYDFSYSLSERQNMDHDAALKVFKKLSSVEGINNAAWFESFNIFATVPYYALTDKYQEYLEDFYYDNTSGSLDSVTEEDLPGRILIVDDDSFKDYVKAAGLDPDDYMNKQSVKLVAFGFVNQPNYTTGRFMDFDLLKVDNLSSLKVATIDYSDGPNFGNTMSSFNLNNISVIERPDVFSSMSGSLNILIPDSLKSTVMTDETDRSNMQMCFYSDAPKTASANLTAAVDNLKLRHSYFYNVYEQTQTVRNMLLILNVFTYGFIVIMTLITIANVFNTITTNVNLRRREFAMLKSIGMTDKGFRKMMAFECIFYGLKALLFGLPVSALTTYFIYRGVMSGVDVRFTLPWTGMIISAVAVFIVVFITMLYAFSKTRKESVVEALKNDNL